MIFEGNGTPHICLWRVIPQCHDISEKPGVKHHPRGNTFHLMTTWRWAFCMLQGYHWCLPRWRLSACGSPDPQRVCPSPELPEKWWDSVSVRLHLDLAFGPLGLSLSLRRQRLEGKWRIKTQGQWRTQKKTVLEWWSAYTGSSLSIQACRVFLGLMFIGTLDLIFL